MVHTGYSAWGSSWSPGCGYRLPLVTTHCHKPDHEMTTSTASSLVLHWGDPEAGPQGELSGSTPTTALLPEKALTSLSGAGGGGYIRVGILSNSWFSLVAKNQDSSSAVCQAKACKGGGERPPLPVFMPVSASLPGESHWVGPQPTTVFRGSKGHWVSVFWQLV